MLLSVDAQSAREARNWVTGVLDAWRRDAPLDDVRLVVTELVANAVVHAGTPVAVRLEVGPDQVRCAVSDAAPGAVTPGAGHADDLGGRGLHLVERVSDRWGVEEGPTGKTVWAEWCSPRRDLGGGGRFPADRPG